jgi:threonine dehydrogenase-like Zn-dependent dehydrogenase
MRLSERSLRLEMMSHSGTSEIELVEHGMEATTVRLIAFQAEAEVADGYTGICSACRKGHYQMCNLGIINGVTKNGGCVYSLSHTRI